MFVMSVLLIYIIPTYTIYIYCNYHYDDLKVIGREIINFYKE